MPHYIMLLKQRVDAHKAIRDKPEILREVEEALARWEAKVVGNWWIMGDYDQCTIFEASDNFRAYRASFAAEIGSTFQTEIMPAIDIPLFARLMTREQVETGGPHPWQNAYWAKLVRLSMRWYAYDRWIRQYFKPLDVRGKDKQKSIKGGCVVIANHRSHMDGVAVHGALSTRLRFSLYSGAAADRYFVKGRDELTMQPWWQSLINGTFPIARGGGSKALDYPKWLLKNGGNILIFPEGTRSTAKGMAKFRHGPSILALETNATVLPIYLNGVDKLRPKGTREVKPGPATALVLDPITFPAGTEVPEATSAMYKALNEVSKRVIEEGIDAVKEGWT
ncbi:MAG: 1-acyl-sn-glycerol-3-phosphate acyltransferase [Pseudomonadaceae bacterium]|nr:1-acyl-sn-glycerol-3-phosphate acyltransferase [Pseudomonadaceae bacterium]